MDKKSFVKIVKIGIMLSTFKNWHEKPAFLNRLKNNNVRVITRISKFFGIARSQIKFQSVCICKIADILIISDLFFGTETSQ